MNQAILNYYILGGTIWRKRRRRNAAAHEEMLKKKLESIELVRDAAAKRVDTEPQRRILTEDGSSASKKS